MGSSRPQDRSLNETTFLPQWMKGRFDNRFDFDESSFSPPSHDDSFFYIRYPRKQEDTKQSFRTIDNKLHGQNKTTNNISQVTSTQELKNQKQVDFSKHHPACQPFFNTANKVNDIASSKIIADKIQTKHLGSDDNLGEVNSESALCGRSIIHVANQMMSKNNKTVQQEQPTDTTHKNVSKSLPATPIASPLNTPDSSPKSRRRVVTNRYFTGPFIPDREKFQSGWILAGLLGQSREVMSEKILEEEEPAAETLPHRTLSRKKSISSQNLTYINKDEKPEKTPTFVSHVLQPKPSEFREMNFWSPTSM